MDYYVIDLDGPNYRFLFNLRKFVAQDQGRPEEDFPIPNDEWGLDIESWGMDRAAFLTYYSLGVRTGDLLWEGEPQDGSVQGWTDIASRPNTYIHVVTSRNPSGAEEQAHEATNYWLAMNGLYYDHISFAWDKVPVVRDHISTMGVPESELRIMTIDDKADNCVAFAEAGWESFVYDYPSNQHLNLPRVSSMLEFAEATRP